MVDIDDTAGKTFIFRALLDSGSQTSFNTADAASKLNLARSTVDVKISGIGGRQQAARELVSLLVGHQKMSVTALVQKSIAGKILSHSIDLKQLKSMKSVVLADENFINLAPCNCCWARMCTRISSWMKGKRTMGCAIANQSSLGWLLECCLMYVPTNGNPVEHDLAGFWEVEESHRVKPMLKENRQSVEHFNTTTYVADDGRLTVRLLFKTEARPLNTFQKAMQIFFALQRELKDHDDVKQQYREFIKEFVDMGHLEKAPQTSSFCYYLLHHCVFEDSTTTKLRVVFDASRKSSNGSSPPTI